MRMFKTIGEVAREFGVPLHRVRYLIDSNKMTADDFEVVSGRRYWSAKAIKKARGLLGLDT